MHFIENIVFYRKKLGRKQQKTVGAFLQIII